MEKKKKYFLYVDGKEIEVSYEVYKVYHSSRRKEKHFMVELKQGRKRIDPLTHETVYIPSLEDSYERLQEFLESKTPKPEDIILNKELRDNLYKAIEMLSESDKELIIEIFFKNKTEKEIAYERGRSIQIINYHKRRILAKLRTYLSE